jgi:hypothetical protein
MQEINYNLLSSDSGYSAREIEDIHKSVAVGADESQLAYFIGFCKEIGLSPILKEVWCFKNKDGGLIVMTGRDGFLKKAQENPDFNGIQSSEVRANDSFESDIPNGKVRHTFGLGEDRGEIVGGYAIVYRKGGEPTVEVVEIGDYNTGRELWLTNEADMIKKVPEAKACKKACGISGLQSEYEFDINGGVAIPVASTEPVVDYATQALELLSSYDGGDKELFRAQCISDNAAGLIDEHYVVALKSQMER